MRMPVDIKSVIEAVSNTQRSVQDRISVSVYIDESAPDALIAHVRTAFAGAGANARVTIAYIEDDVAGFGGGDRGGVGHGGVGNGGEISVDPSNDVAVICAGVSECVGAAASKIRAAGVPVMIVTTLPNLVGDLASALGTPIPEGDLVFPEDAGAKGAGEGAGAVRAAVASVFGAGKPGEGAAESNSQGELIELDDAATRRLDIRMGKWIITTCEHRKLAFAAAFPFVRRPLALASISVTSVQNAAVGLVPFIPGADMPVMTLNQVKMLLQIAAAYNQPLDKSRIKELVALLGGAYASRQIVRSATKVIPGAGWLISGAVGYSATEAFGRAAIEYFEAGGDLKGLANVIEKATSATSEVVNSAANSQVGQTIIENLKQAASQLLGSKKN